MTWRDRSKPSSKGSGDKPSLEAVLDLYNVRYTPYKTTQMTHCPLHDDRTSSLSLNLDKQLWKCHSCGNGGDSWELLKKMEDTDFDGARAHAAAVHLPVLQLLPRTRYGL